MDEQYITLPLTRYTELIKKEQKAEQYKKILLSYSNRKPFMDILLTIEQKFLSELNSEYIESEEKQDGKIKFR